MVNLNQVIFRCSFSGKVYPYQNKANQFLFSFPLYHGGSYDVLESIYIYLYTHTLYMQLLLLVHALKTPLGYMQLQTCMQNQPLLHMHVLHVASVFIHFFLYNVDLFSCSSVCHVACSFSARNKRSMTNFINACNVSWLLITCTLLLSIH